MRKYDALWQYIGQSGVSTLTLSYAEIEKIVGFPIDHSFLTYKKELSAYGYHVEKISMKAQTVRFDRDEA